MRKQTLWILCLTCFILLLQVLSIQELPVGSIPLISNGGAAAAEKALTQFLDAWVEGDTDTLLGMLVTEAPAAERDDSAFLLQTLGRYRLSEYRLEGEITDISRTGQRDRKTFSCLVLIRDPFGYYAFRLLPQMVYSKREWHVEANTVQQRTQIRLEEYEDQGIAVHEAI